MQNKTQQAGSSDKSMDKTQHKQGDSQTSHNQQGKGSLNQQSGSHKDDTKSSLDKSSQDRQHTSSLTGTSSSSHGKS